MKCLNIALTASVFVLALCLPVVHADFATTVISSVPAPGQYVNDPFYNDPINALGAPDGAGTNAPSNASVVSLGGFGGSIVLGFEATVWDDPNNYLGLDFIVYGNAFHVSADPQRRWAEPAVIEIMRDVDGDGIPGTAPGEFWALIPGTDLDCTAARETVTWDETPGGPYPPANINWFPFVGVYPFLPDGPSVIPLDGDGRYTTSAVPLDAAEIFADPNGQGGTIGIAINPNLGDEDPDNDRFEARYGYGDVSPTLKLGDFDADNVVDDPAADPTSFYTMPDNPYRVGVTPGSGGGDAFDIAWACDPTTGQPANIDGFDFIRLSNPVDAVLGVLGEVSPEISAVADVRPIPCPGDVNDDAQVNLVDLLAVRNRLEIEDPDAGFSIAADAFADGVIDLADLVEVRNREGQVCE